MPTEKEINDVKDSIYKTLKRGGGFMNNIIGAKLKEFAVSHGSDEADKIVVGMGLERLAGIPTQNSKR